MTLRKLQFVTALGRLTSSGGRTYLGGIATSVGRRSLAATPSRSGIRAVTLLGRPMLFFESCKPHACTKDEADAAVAPDGDKIFGVILRNGRPIPVDHPTHSQMACLRALADSDSQSTC